MRIFLKVFLLGVIFNPAFGFNIDTLSTFSNSMNKEIKSVIILPESYSDISQKFPVLYLLHGAYGNYANWIEKAPELQNYATHYNMIIVCPDGNQFSWYFDSKVDPNSQYETYISQELVKSIDKNYRTINDRKSRAITGLSMGGHGAFYVAFRNQNIYGAAGSMSGGLDIRPFPNNWEIKNRLGEYAKNKNAWEENTIINMAYLLQNKSLKLIMDCGINDFFFDANQRFHKKLLERNIEHDYSERPGEHNWDYWTNSLEYHLVFFNQFFNKNKK